MSFATNCCQRCGAAFIGPKGKPPAETQKQMDLYPEIPRLQLVCSKHGKWIEIFDDLFPVYWENNKCKEC